MKKTHLRTPYNYDRHAASERSGTVNLLPSLARQEFKVESDINTVVKNFGVGYTMPENFRVPTYGDFSDIGDYHSACNAIALANESFDELPADVRIRFNNDPGQFVDFALNSKNRDQLMEMGMIPKPALQPAPLPKPAETPPPAPSPA